MSQPRAVIFDIGNVLLEWAPERLYDARLGAAERRRFFAETGIEAMNLAVDAGAPFRASVEALAARHPGWATQIRWWHDDWIQMARPLIDGSVALLRALRAKGIPVLALTNFGEDTFTLAQRHYPVLSEFDHAFVSARIGAIKPDPEIYRHLEDETGFAPDRLLFTDDRPENIAAAAARGWHVHLFTGWQPFAARLVDEGLLSRKEAGL